MQYVIQTKQFGQFEYEWILDDLKKIFNCLNLIIIYFLLPY